ncbi:hypothetical protein DPMN_141998 [Dreissena polymorpha]|uniref:Uncharacterized protein n=1 Tax=Dreissena polymorpha TaxID=45954 RepID=A0A9D4GB12_DREPO|nr:hypothetical protein DPMN_141998 [Dreissena polymorpha]
MVNCTYTGSDGDYNCRDKQCCYESDDASIDDEYYFNSQQLDVFTDSDHDDSNVHVYRDDLGYDVGDHDDSNIHVYRDDLGYDDGSYFDYDLYSDYDYSSEGDSYNDSRELVFSLLLVWRRFRETQLLYRANKIIGQSQTQIILKKQDTILFSQKIQPMKTSLVSRSFSSGQRQIYQRQHYDSDYSLDEEEYEKLFEDDSDW